MKKAILCAAAGVLTLCLLVGCNEAALSNGLPDGPISLTSVTQGTTLAQGTMATTTAGTTAGGTTKATATLPKKVTTKKTTTQKTAQRKTETPPQPTVAITTKVGGQNIGGYTAEQFFREYGDQVAAIDGTTFDNKKTARDTDTVSMVNLYVNRGIDTPITAFAAADTKVRNILKTGGSGMVDLGLPIDKATDYITAFYNLRGYQIELQYQEGGATLFVSAEDLRARQAAYNAAVLDNGSADAKNIFVAIRACGITKGMLQKDAIAKINTYICNKVEYDYQNYAFTLPAFFNQGKAICNSYAQVFELMCRSVGINATFVTGYAGEPHAWNAVTFSDGSRYLVDACWNDSYVSFGEQRFQNFNRFLLASSIANRTQQGEMVVGYMEFAAPIL